MAVKEYFLIIPDTLDNLNKEYLEFREGKHIMELVSGIEKVCKNAANYRKNKNHIHKDVWYFEALLDDILVACFPCRGIEGERIELYKKRDEKMQDITEIILRLTDEFSKYN